MRAVALVLLLARTWAFRTPRRTPLRMGVELSRRQVASAVSLGALSALGGPMVAAAGVGEGDLPEGARRFNNVLRAQKTWAELGDAVAKRGSEFDDKEWVNVQQVLRAVYQVGEDIKVVAKGNNNEKDLLGLAKTMQEKIQSADAPAKQKDASLFLGIHKEVAASFKEFFDLLSDVPDEL